MAITASAILKRAIVILQDATNTRWSTDEMIGWLNDGQREIVTYRPDANTKYGTGTLAAGPRQDLTTMSGITNPAKLIDIVRNMASGSNKSAVRIMSRDDMDAQVIGWYAMTGSINTIHYMFDGRDPRSFYVYPPALSNTQLEIVYSAFPVDVPAPTGTDLTGVTGSIGVSDFYANALLDYVLYRCFSKDGEFTENASRAVMYYGAFSQALGGEIKATALVNPLTPSRPNTPKRVAAAGG